MALMVQVPALTKVRVPPLVTVHTPGVMEVKVTLYPTPAEELAVNVGVVPKVCAPGVLKVMVCGAAGVALLDAADAAPVPAELAAVTVKV